MNGGGAEARLGWSEVGMAGEEVEAASVRHPLPLPLVWVW